MRVKRLRRLFLMILAGSLAEGNLCFAKEEPVASKPPAPLILALPPSATPGSTDSVLRATALRMFVYEGKTAEAIQRLREEKNSFVFLSTLSAIGATRDASATDFVIGQCNSPDETVAATAVSILPLLNIKDPGIYRSALQHKSAKVQLAAIRALGDSAVAESFAPEIEKLAGSPENSISQAATLSWLKIIAQRSSGSEQAAILSESGKIIDKNPSHAPVVINALLALGIRPDQQVSAKLLALPVEQHRNILRIYSYFPNLFESDFIRSLAMSNDAESAQMALSMLASKTSPKNDASLGVISQVLASGEGNRISAILNSFDSDSEFALVGRNFSDTSAETSEARNDLFTGPGNNPGSITGALAPAIRQSSSRKKSGSRENMPSLQEINRFFNALAGVATNKSLPAALQNRATLLSLDQSNSPKLLDAVHRMLNTDRIPILQTGVNICAKRYDDLRYIGLALKFITASQTLPVESFIANPGILEPYLNLDDPVATQVLGHFGRLLIVEKNSQKNLLGLALLATHGTPANASYILPLCESPDPVIRRAAYHCLARLAPEIYLIRISTIAGDSDAGVRGTLPLAFFKTGYRWEHPLGNGKGCAQWVTPNISATPEEQALGILQKLASDSDPTIRLNSRLALLQHGQFADSSAILSDADGSGNSLFTARLTQSVHASGKKTPEPFSAFIPSAAPTPTPDKTRTLAIFINPVSRARADLEGCIDALRQTVPNIDVQVHYTNEESSVKKLSQLLRIFPISARPDAAPNLAVSPGAWVSGDNIDFTSLIELLSHANNTDGSAFETILNDSGNNIAETSIKPVTLVVLSAIGVIAIFVLVATGVYLRRRSA